MLCVITWKIFYNHLTEILATMNDIPSPYHSDFGTPEMHKRQEIIISGARAEKKVACVKYSCPLEYYLAKEYVTDEQYRAGTLFSLAWYRSGGSPNTTCRYEKEVRTFGGVEDELNFYHDAELEYSEAYRQIGLPYRNIIVEVCLLERYLNKNQENKNWRIKKKEMEKLKKGLDELAAHYRLLREMERGEE